MVAADSAVQLGLLRSMDVGQGCPPGQCSAGAGAGDEARGGVACCCKKKQRVQDRQHSSRCPVCAWLRYQALLLIKMKITINLSINGLI
jgi:hypothetical protein